MVTAADIEIIFRREYGRAVASLVRVCGSIDLAEDAVQEAFKEAVQRWPSAGLPPSPAGWIITTAKNRAIDYLRRESSRAERQSQAALLYAEGFSEQAMRSAIEDDRLQLIFVCCHPSLAMNVRVALTLRLLGGLSTLEIANAFLISESTMAQRLLRAKAKIRDAGIPYRVPEQSELPSRLLSVMAVVYLILNEGYSASLDDSLQREDLCSEAIRLGRVLVELLPDEPEALGLLALMLLLDARRNARLVDGKMILLADQDRSKWDKARIAEGLTLVRQCLVGNQLGPYQIQAAINAVHCDAASAQQVDWLQVLQLYDQLYAEQPTAVVALNRAVAVAEISGPQRALEIVDRLDLQNYYLFHAIRANLLRRLKRLDEAMSAYSAAIALCNNNVERNFLSEQHAALRKS
jgi:RNA polymerase sigma-70 factor, ECF subfamily